MVNQDGGPARVLTLSTTSSTLAFILYLCTGDVPTARVYRVWIPIACIAALPVAHRIKRRLGIDPREEGSAGPYENSVDLGRNEIKEEGGEVFAAGRHECGKWKVLVAQGVFLAFSLMLLVASAAAGRILEVICVLAFASPLLNLIPQSSSAPNHSSPSTDPSPFLLISIVSISLYMTTTFPSHRILPSIFTNNSIWSASASGLAGVGFALGLVGMRSGAGRLVGEMLGDGKGQGGCRGCEERVAGIAGVIVAILTFILFPIYAPGFRSLPLIFLTAGLFAWSPPTILSNSPAPASNDAAPAQSSADQIFLELMATTILLAIVKHRETAYTVQALLFGMAVLVIHLFREASRSSSSMATTLPSSSSGGKGFLASNGDEISPSTTRRRRVYLAIACAPALLWAVKRVHGLGSGSNTVGLAGTTWETENLGVQAETWQKVVDYELAIAYYNEPRASLSETIALVKSNLPSGSISRTTVYAKGPETLAANVVGELEGLMNEVGADAVVELKNQGREGETYLQHITRNYASSATPLATHTIFLQPHLAWDWVAKPRLTRLRPEIGFVSLGPYLNATCSGDGNERDSHGMSFGRISQIYSAFNGDFCPPTGFAITWAGQFVVSRTRILSTPLATYQNLLDYFTVPKGEDQPKDWIWNEGWWNSQPSDPTHGHWLERSWPAVFHCTRPELAWDCGEGSGAACECLDE